jgi:hypothetical protein
MSGSRGLGDAIVSVAMCMAEFDTRFANPPGEPSHFTAGCLVLYRLSHLTFTL